MMDLEQTRKKLKKYSQFEEDEDNIERFLTLVDEIVLNKESSLFGDIVQYFDDSSDYDWAFDCAGDALEHLPAEEYISQLLLNLKRMVPRALECTSPLVIKILNDESDQAIFIENMHKADKESLLKVFDDIEYGFEHHQELIQQLRKQLEGASKKERE